jgi:hypothetical protein
MCSSTPSFDGNKKKIGNLFDMSCEISHTSKCTYIRKSEGKRGGSDKYEKIESIVHYCLLIIKYLKLNVCEDKHINC